MIMVDKSSDAALRPNELLCAVPRLSYSVPEAARATGLGKTTLYGLIGSGDLPSSKIAGRRLIATADLLALLKRNRTAGVIPAALPH